MFILQDKFLKPHIQDQRTFKKNLKNRRIEIQRSFEKISSKNSKFREKFLKKKSKYKEPQKHQIKCLTINRTFKKNSYQSTEPKDIQEKSKIRRLGGRDLREKNLKNVRVEPSTKIFNQKQDFLEKFLIIKFLGAKGPFLQRILKNPRLRGHRTSRKCFNNQPDFQKMLNDLPLKNLQNKF